MATPGDIDLLQIAESVGIGRDWRRNLLYMAYDHPAGTAEVHAGSSNCCTCNSAELEPFSSASAKAYCGCGRQGRTKPCALFCIKKIGATNAVGDRFVASGNRRLRIDGWLARA